MAEILSGDIKLRKSEVMLDENDGGGAMTKLEITDGQSNNLFSDIDEIDRVYGRVSLRKAYVHINTPGTPSAFQMHLIVAKKPVDPNVSVNLFTTNDWFDRRTNAQNRIESYLAKGVKWEGHLLETQIVGQRAIQLSLEENSSNIPNNGETLVLVAYEGKTTEYYQYVRITEVTNVEIRTFIVEQKEVKRKIVTCSISDSLRNTFEGQTVKDFINGKDPIAFARESRVADASRYYGIATLTQNIVIGDAKIKIDSIFSQLVPSSQTETPMIDIDAAGQNTVLIPSSTGKISVTYVVTVNSSQALYIGSSVLPKTMAFTLFGAQISDIGGQLKNASGTTVGFIDYQNGTINWNSAAGTGTTSITFNFIPAAVPVKPMSTFLKRVTIENRAYNWVFSLLPIPSPGSTKISYVSQGKVYTLQDNGSGQLIGADAGFGSGTVSYETGSVLLTTGALPDVETGILAVWGNYLDSFIRSNMAISKAYIELGFGEESMVSGSLNVTWLQGGETKTASDNGRGQFTGDATGTIDYALGKAKLCPALLPNGGTTFSMTYSKGEKKEEIISTTPSDGSFTFEITSTESLIPGSIFISAPFFFKINENSEPIQLSVDLVDRSIDSVNGDLVNAKGVKLGVINYLTRRVTITPSAKFRQATQNYGVAVSYMG